MYKSKNSSKHMLSSVVRRVICILGLATLLHAGAPFADEHATDLNDIRAIITDDSDENHGRAANLLARYISTIYGVEIPVNPEGLEPSPAVSDVILVGRDAVLAANTIALEELEQVRHDGFVIRAENGRISLAGYASRGAVYAAYELLEQWGCRFYASGVETLPEPDGTLVDNIYVQDKPAFQFRSGGRWFGRNSVDALGDPRQALNPELFTREAGSNLWINHTAGYLVPKLLYYDDHPEYYALQADGARIPKTTSDQRIMLCTTHPDVLRISTQRTLGWMEKQPERRFFFVTPGDSAIWCHCEACEALDRVPGNYSDRYLEYVNHIAREVKKEFPDNYIIAGAYIGTTIAPVEKKPEDNVLLFYAAYFGIGRSMAHTYTHPVNIESLKQLEEWLDMAPQMGITMYNLGHIPSWDAVAGNIRWFADIDNIIAVRSLGSPRPFQAMFQYIYDRMSWDPALDPEELKSDFVSAYYGDAAPYLLEYLEMVKQRLEKGYPKMIYECCMPPAYFSVSFTAGALKLFDNAMEAVRTDATKLDRIKRERDEFMAEYRNSVNLATDGVSGRGILRKPPSYYQRRQALGLFKEYLADLIEEGASGDDIRVRLNRFAGLNVPQEGVDIISVAEDFIEDSDAVIAIYRRAPRQIAQAEPVEGGIRLTAESFFNPFYREGGRQPSVYSWLCEPRMSLGVGARRSERISEIQALFYLDSEPQGSAVLRMEGQDADKDTPPPAQIAILINGREIFSGSCGFVKRGWSWREFAIEDGVLRKGLNQIEIRNIKDSRRMDHYWFILSEAQILF